MKKIKTEHILISRTDSIGDVVLTLPLCGLIKKYLGSHVKISFLARSYTKAVIDHCQHIDHFLNWDNREELDLQGIDTIIHVFPRKQIAFWCRSQIPQRIGTRNRWHHWLTCNFLPKVSRSKSDLHESQLNALLLEPLLGERKVFSIDEITQSYGLIGNSNEPVYQKFLSHEKPNIILHPRSLGSAQEWPLTSYQELIQKYHHQIHFIVSGTDRDNKSFHGFFDKLNVSNICGKFSLSQFIDFISCCDGLVAASTGPLHISAALGRPTLGLFAPYKPIHPGRWRPLGNKAQTICYQKGEDMSALTVDQVYEKIKIWIGH